MAKSKKTANYKPTKKEVEARAKATKTEMKRLGIKNIKDYIDYIDKGRGY